MPQMAGLPRLATTSRVAAEAMAFPADRWLDWGSIRPGAATALPAPARADAHR